MIEFPQEFLFGTATSAHQIEGNNRNNQWWAAEQEGTIPHKSGKACNHWKRFREDIELMKELGYEAYRFSIEWSRIIPNPNEVNEGALGRYQEIIDLLHTYDIQPMVTLHHFTNPQWFMQLGGFTRRENLTYWQHYVETIAKRLDGLHLLTTFNEPIVYVVESYLQGHWPPFKESAGVASSVGANLLRAHHIAYDHLKKHISNVKVGLVKNYAHIRPKSEGWLDRRAATRANNFFNWNYLDAIWSGHFDGLLPWKGYDVPESDVDFLGLNYYVMQEAKHSWNPFDLFLTVHEADLERRETLMGWKPYPRGLYEGIVQFQDRYAKPIYVTENGIATNDDSWRIRYILEHLLYVHKAIEEGYDVRGYLHWSFMDNFEWAEGFEPRFGLVKVNYSTFERTPRESAHIFGNIAQSKQISKNLLATYGVEPFSRD